ncbi:hypothetical protein B0I35DRAFT_437318 [Stachybotrys elegans]|uniref:FAR1 domain-containing protein n=1 Tax=Stachybotrys elegans TaxID=80388 RepID=A0A8K0SQX2_9HYPO|nr:hypothetical protein B0I35DRAFT_437318 [Stachybotrys elegans]
MFGILQAINVPPVKFTPQPGLYESYDELIAELSGRMEKDGYKVVKNRSHRAVVPGISDNDKMLIRCDLVCDRGGAPYKCQAKKLKTSTKKTNCPWSARAQYRKQVNGWTLAIICDQHNHEPGTPEPPTLSEKGDDEDEDEVPPEVEGQQDGPRTDPETAGALQLAGVQDTSIRLSGETFQQFKNEYRKMYHADRYSILSQLQLRIAAIYAVQNEELQRERRREAQSKRHRDIEESRQRLASQPTKRARTTTSNNPRQSDQPSPSTHTPSQPSSEQQTPQQMLQPRSQNQRQMRAPPNTEFMFPVPGFDVDEMPMAPVYPGPPRRIRGRPSQNADSASG